MGTALFLLGFVALGFIPAVTIFLKRKWVRVAVSFVWLGAGAAWLLSDSANNPHAFGMAMFMIFFLGWMIAFAVIVSRRTSVQKIGEPQA